MASYTVDMWAVHPPPLPCTFPWSSWVGQASNSKQVYSIAGTASQPRQGLRIAARFTYLEMEMLEGKGVVQTHSLDVRI
eukprot:scaffold117721_cov20-Tisochrysis_lutea.AAC.4